MTLWRWRSRRRSELRAGPRSRMVADRPRAVGQLGHSRPATRLRCYSKAVGQAGASVRVGRQRSALAVNDCWASRRPNEKAPRKSSWATNMSTRTLHTLIYSSRRMCLGNVSAPARWARLVPTDLGRSSGLSHSSAPAYGCNSGSGTRLRAAASLTLMPRARNAACAVCWPMTTCPSTPRRIIMIAASTPPTISANTPLT